MLISWQWSFCQDSSCGCRLAPEHAHTTVLLLFWNMSGTTWVSRYQKGKTRKVKTNLDLPEQEIVSDSGICWAICKSAPHPRQPRQHPTTQFLRAGSSSWCPTNSVKALKEDVGPEKKDLNYLSTRLVSCIVHSGDHTSHIGVSKEIIKNKTAAEHIVCLAGSLDGLHSVSSIWHEIWWAVILGPDSQPVLGYINDHEFMIITLNILMITNFVWTV